MKLIWIALASLGAILSSEYGVALQLRSEAGSLVESLREYPAPMPAGNRARFTEQPRWQTIDRLRELAHEGVDALARALADPDVRMRRNALIALGALGSGLSALGRTAPIDIGSASGALATAMADVDDLVRAWATNALGMVATASEHFVAFILALDDPSAGVRLSACGALNRIGKPIPEAIERKVNDEHSDVRTCARNVSSKLGGD